VPRRVSLMVILAPAFACEIFHKPTIGATGLKYLRDFVPNSTVKWPLLCNTGPVLTVGDPNGSSVERFSAACCI
jgi:hypothetical protein